MSATEEAAFWAALAADPADDTARLAFIDWLDERSDPRARWLRDADLARYMRPGASDPIPGLFEALDSEDYGVWDPATELFGRIGPSVVPALLARAKDEDYDRASRAVRALAGMDADSLRPILGELIALLAAPVSYEACNALEKLGPDVAPNVPALVAAEEHDYITARSFASVMRAIGPGAEPAVPRLVTIMCWNTDDASSEAAAALAAIGLHTLDAALDGLNRVDADYFYHGAYGIERFGEAAVPRLTEVANEPPGDRRTGAILALARLAPAVAAPHLIDLLRTTHSSYVLELILERVTELGPAAAEAAPALREMLRGDSGRGYEDAVANALAAVTGDAGIPDLVAQLDDPDPTFRRRTLHALAKLAGGHADARSALYRGLTDADREVKVESLGLLNSVLRRGDEDCVEPLRPCLGDADPQIRAYAAGVLGQIKSAAAPLVPELIARMRDPDEEVRAAAVQTVDGMQYETPEMLGALLAALDDESEAVRRAAAHGLHEWGHMYPEHTAAVFARVNDPDPDIARSAARLAGKAAEPTPELVAYLRETLRSAADDELRASAAAGLGNMKVAEPDVITDLFRFLDATGRDEAVKALTQLGPDAMAGLGERLITRPDLRREITRTLFWQRGETGVTGAALPGLIACLGDPDSSTRSDAVKVIGDLRHAAAEALPRLRECLADGDQFVRSAAVAAVAKVCPTPADVLPDVLRVLGDEEQYPRKNAMEVLRDLEVPPEAKLPHILAALADDDKDMVQEAVKAAAKLGPVAAEAIPLLVPLLSHEDKWVRGHAVEGCGLVGGAAAVTQMRELLKDEEEWVRCKAATAFGDLGPAGGEAVPDLVKLVSEDPDDDVRRSAAEALGKLGATPEAAEAVAGLVAMLWSADGEARANAAQALGALGPVARPAVPELARAMADPAWGDVSKETRKRHTFEGISLLPMELTDALAAIDQRIHVTTALRQIGPPEDVIPALVAALGDANGLVANSAASELNDLLPASEPALRALRDHADENVRSRAEWALSPPEEEEDDEDDE